MTIDPDVRGMSAHFGVDPTLIQAVVNAEGNIVRAVQCSIKGVVTREQALAVLCRSAAHAMSDFVKTNHASDFVLFWGSRWAPLGVANDPHNLNQFWSTNVYHLWLGTPKGGPAAPPRDTGGGSSDGA